MERNADGYTGGSSSGAGAAGSTGGYGNSGDISGSAGYGAGTGGSSAGTSGSSGSGSSSGGSSSGGGDASGIADRARDIAGNAKDKLSDVGSSVRSGAGNAKDKLADALETGANKLRQRGGQGQFSASAGSADINVSGDGVSQVSDRLAGGMQATADWLRDADMDGMRTGIERQVKDHPGRTLLIAVGLGYLLGKAFRK